MKRLLFLPFVAMLALSAASLRAQASDPLAPSDALIEGGKYAEAEKAARAALARVEADEGPQSAAASHVLNRLCDSQPGLAPGVARRVRAVEDGVHPRPRHAPHRTRSRPPRSS